MVSHIWTKNLSNLYWDQGASWFSFFWDFPSGHVGGRLLPASLHGLPSLCISFQIPSGKLLWSFLITTFITLVVIGRLRFSGSSWVLEDCIFQGMYPFHPDCSICWHTVVCNIFLQVLVFLCSQLILLSHFRFYLFGSSLFFFLMSLVKSILTLSSHRTRSWFHWSFAFFKTLLHLFLLWSLLFLSFYSLWALLVVLSLVLLSV